MLRLLLGVGLWLVVSGAIAVAIFAGSERTIDLASHEAKVSPDFSGDVVLHTGPVLPDFRTSSGSRLGVEIELGKSDTDSLQELTARYAAIASQPDGQVLAVQRAVVSMALQAGVQGLVLGAVPFVALALLGGERRRELLRSLRTPKGVAGGLALAVFVTAIVVPLRWGRHDPVPEPWAPLGQFLGGEFTLPEAAKGVEITTSATTAQTKKLIGSAVSSYQQGESFYSKAAKDADDLELREPEEDEKVALLVSDRHLNVGMDKVARAVAEQGGATAVFDAGDDTSTGARWEAFSLDSVSAAFKDYDGRWAVAGNHDNGDFVRSHMEDLGWTYFDGKVVDGPDGGRILGVDDPRASGLGNWRDETGLSSAEVAKRLTETVCAADEDGDRVNTLLLHDADFGDDALAQGCVDLVIGGHTHVTTGPTAVEAEDGTIGYTFTNGTSGGAAYAIAIGSKLRRTATVSLITYREGRPVGIQAVDLQTNGVFVVGEWTALTY